MIEQPGLLLIEIFDMHEHLVDAFIDPLFILVFLSHLVEEQHCHEQGIDPHLTLIEAHALTVAVGAGHMLEPAFLCPRDAVHQPVCPVKAEFFEFLIMVILIELCQGKQRRRCIDIP